MLIMVTRFNQGSVLIYRAKKGKHGLRVGWGLGVLQPWTCPVILFFVVLLTFTVMFVCLLI